MCTERRPVVALILSCRSGGWWRLIPSRPAAASAAEAAAATRWSGDGEEWSRLATQRMSFERTGRQRQMTGRYDAVMRAQKPTLQTANWVTVRTVDGHYMSQRKMKLRQKQFQLFASPLITSTSVKPILKHICLIGSFITSHTITNKNPLYTTRGLRIRFF